MSDNDNAAALRVLRGRAGLSQTELARGAGLSKHAISRMEAGKRGIPVEDLTRILVALGVDWAGWGEAVALARKASGGPSRDLSSTRGRDA